MQQQSATRRWIVGGVVALVGAGACVGAGAATPVAAPLSAVQALAVELTATDITLDFVRHGESTDNVAGILGTLPPGAHLTATGEQQAQDVAPVLAHEFPGGVDGIYASELVRTQETAAPFADLEHMNVQILPGLNEINAGILEGLRAGRLGEILYIAAPFMWTLGLKFVPQWFSSIDPNGFAFDKRFTEAVDTIYNNSLAEPHSTGTDVAFSHAAAIMVWTMMNVKNPDPLLIFKDPLDNTGQVVINGNPTDGWTLESWNGTSVSQDPSGAAALFADLRDLFVTPHAGLPGDLVQAAAAVDPGDLLGAMI